MPDIFDRRWLRRLPFILWSSGLLMLSCHASARFETDGYELVYTAPTETQLQAEDLRRSDDVWREMFAAAQQRIDIAQFYVANQSGSRLDAVLHALREAGERGVKIRFLMEEKGLRNSTPETLEQLKSIPGLELRLMPFGKLSGGIIHAKYFVVDDRQAFVGSQNFDWRALEHIQETGLRISDAPVVAQIAAVFNQDWQAQALLAADQPVPPVPQAADSTDLRSGNYLVASPRNWNPPGVIDSQAALPQLLASAQNSIRVQVMDYAPLSYGPQRSRPFYPLIDNALRSAAARGVHIELMVANWNTDRPDIDWLKSLALVPGVQIKIVTIPPASSGFIPYARVIHSKIMILDDRLAWIGTSNWRGGYFDNSRNLELVMNNESMAQRLNQLYQQLWHSPYAAALRIDYDYPPPQPGGEKKSP
ncbi:phosphatidylserine/phosphatidylglycerophosphate/cardiolipin synthase-like enzyme [Pantoea alhagi]|nr:phosphatidylserine/phosphatidylglycerophosphate/cardiolipin synthase-like enzyme [Pantoea alhagi]